MTNQALNRPATIQIVDDDPAMRLLTRATLEKAGFKVIEAADGIDGLAQFRKIRPDLVLLDVLMPRMDGFTTCRRLRSLPESKETPIIMLTGLDDVESVQKAFDAGATDFINKPINWLLLRYRVMHMLRTARLHKDLRTSQSRLSLAQRIARLGHWHLCLETGHFECGDEIRSLLGIAEDVTIDKPHQLLQNIHPEDRQRVQQTLEEALYHHRPYQENYRLVIQGKIHYINSQAEIQKTDLGDPKTITGVVQDVSDMHQAEQKIFRLSHFDALTGLAKRSFFMEKLSAAIQLTEQTQNQLAVLILDLDRFKRINKTLGHVLGDHILLNIAKRIRKSLQECEILFPGSAHEDYCIARFGGNEFAILLPEIDSAEQVSSIANQLIRDISRPFLLDTCEVLITTSIGICLFPDDADNHESIIRNADTALRQAKAQGRDTFRLYHVSMSSSLQNNLRLENDLRKALTNDELVLYAQPQVEMRSGRIFGAEILVRWLHPQDGIKLPGEFLPLALETGLIVDIDQWVLRQACRQLASWQEAGIDDLRLSVNVSGQLFAHSNVADVIGGIVRQSGVRPDKLEIELTESTIMKNNVETISNLNRLKGLGLNIAIDDFGTGYSSLSYLKNFPVDTIKIDRAFIRDLSHSPSDIAITRAIIALGESLGLRTICEGIETTQQKEMLLDLGCYHAQGYLFSKPEPIDTFSLRLGKNDKNDSMQNSCWPTAASMGTCRNVKSEL